LTFSHAENWKKLQKAYDDVDDVDLFAGGFMETEGEVCEDGKSGFEQCGILGPTFRCIIGDTFKGLKYGDRYFYDLGLDQVHRFSLDELDEIRKSTFSRILCDNSPISEIQPNAFLTPDSHLDSSQRRVVSCDDIPSMDLELFKPISGNDYNNEK
jgi:peroxidase